MPPTTFQLRDRFIHSSSSPTPVYSLSNPIQTSLKPGAPDIEFHHLDPSPTHIYNLARLAVVPVGDFRLELRAVSASSLGDIILKESPGVRSGYRATSKSGDGYHFVVKEKEDAYEWSDAEGNLVATMSGAKDGYSLTLQSELTQRETDGLVAVWCLWVWHAAALAAPKVKKTLWERFIHFMEPKDGLYLG